MSIPTTVLYCTVVYSTILYRAELYPAALYRTVLIYGEVCRTEPYTFTGSVFQY